MLDGSGVRDRDFLIRALGSGCFGSVVPQMLPAQKISEYLALNGQVGGSGGGGCGGIRGVFRLVAAEVAVVGEVDAVVVDEELQE